MDSTARLLAEIVHEFDGIIGNLRLPRVKLWRGSPLGGLISIPHVTCFGAAYIELFGLKRLLSAPVFKAQQYYENAVVLQLFGSLVSVDCDEWRLMPHRCYELFSDRTLCRFGSVAFLPNC